MKINVIVTPNSRVPAVIKVGDNNYKVKVNARAAEGRANARLIEILSDYLDTPKSRIRILKGLSSRNKLVEIGV
jgi:uncharacterized protein YggU (UPF0235/DUF167 family)